MYISRSTFVVFVVVVFVITPSVTAFKKDRAKATSQQRVRQNPRQGYEDKRERYPIAEYDEQGPTDLAKRAKLRLQKKRYDKEAPFTNPGPSDEELAFRPEAQFNFPDFPVKKSDVIVIAEVLEAKAHRSENKMNVFSNFEIRVNDVLKGNQLSIGSILTIERVGGYVVYPTGRKVLFRLLGNGMPAVGVRYAFFLAVNEDNYTIITGYELGEEGIKPLDNSPQFQQHYGELEESFLKKLRNTITEAP